MKLKLQTNKGKSFMHCNYELFQHQRQIYYSRHNTFRHYHVQLSAPPDFHIKHRSQSHPDYLKCNI